ncbi:hypothetical protein V6N11_019885 [Hibiscus sabdariffa]|uniref:Uncharacterized protein n=1 Tax=Hibiscus sabdariffa TaxID=183260 RepID=A0ABR2NB24_9ROSI
MDLELADRSIAIVPAAIPISQSEITTTTPAILQAPSLVSALPSYKDTFLGDIQANTPVDVEIIEEEDIDLLDSDVTRSLIDGIISIEFSERVQSLAVKSLDNTVVLKLLDRRIGYNTLRTRFDLALPLSTQVIDPPAQQFAKPFGPWMLVKRRGRKSIRKETKPPNDKFRVGIEGSRFNLIFDVDGEETLAASKEQSILPSSSPAIPTPVSACVPASPREVPNQGMDFEVPIDNVNVDIAAPRNLGKKPVVPRPLRSTISPSVSPPKSSVSPSVRKSHEKRVH